MRKRSYQIFGSNKKMLISNNLPEDLMKEIMATLPAKSLVRFKCVSKSWYALITDPSFIIKHLEFSKSITRKRCLNLLLQLHPLREPSNISLISKDEPYLLYDTEFPQIPGNDFQFVSISNQCNGIFCLYGFLKGHNPYDEDRQVLIMWNPSTREVKVIHYSSDQINPKYACHVNIGFGFDHKTKDYKVLCTGEEEEPKVKVYNLSTDTWRTLDVDVPIYIFSYPRSSSYLNGVYHRSALRRSGNIMKEFVLSFDFSKDAFGTIQLPFGISSHVEKVGVVDEKLACLCFGLNLECEIWVMNEYGVEDSWSKKLKIELPNILKWTFIGSVLGFFGDNEILVQENDGLLISYDLQSRPIQKFQRHIRGGSFVFMCDYVESLVPLNGGGGRKHLKNI